MRVGIVADDLTGAADSAAPFASRGMRCAAVVCDLQPSATIQAGYDVVAISTETRDGTCEDIIRAAVTEAVRELNAIDSPQQILCKKIDSTLRGNLAIELNAIRSAAPERIPIICPAFPAQGRTVVDRMLVVNGELRQRVYESFDLSLYLYSEHLNLSDIRRGAEKVCRWLDKKAGNRALFFDAETDRDLAIVSTAVLQSPARWLPVGSAGFMAAIAGSIGRTSSETARFTEIKNRLVSGPVLYIIGSKSSVARRQIAEMERAAGTLSVSTVGEALQTIVSGSRIAIAASPEAEQDREAVLRNLLIGIQEFEHRRSEITLVVTGGATAAALLKRWTEFSHLDVLGEFEPGVVVTNVVRRSSGNTSTPIVHLVLKAGAFGNSQTMSRIAGL